jgi:hypothetical protein
MSDHGTTYGIEMFEDDDVDPFMRRYPPADMTPDEFEEFVAETLGLAAPLVEGFGVTLHDKIVGADGTYDFDATVRFKVAGMEFLVIVEAKKHTHRIKRELVQVLCQKMQSVGAQKAVLISTAPFQRGAVDFATAHGIALVMVTESRFTFITRSATPPPPLTREEAAEYGMPTYAGLHFGAGSEPGSIMMTTLTREQPEYVLEMLMGHVIEAA